MTTDAADAPPDAERDDPLLAVEGLHVSYGKVRALKGVDLHVDAGEIVSIIGPNGAGKTTLSEATTGFVDYAGHIRFRGTEVATCSTAELVGMGLVMCTESRDLFEFMSVEDNLRLGAFRDADGAESRLKFVYELFPRLEERRTQLARTMSGGEQQMLTIGRALMGDPTLLILDEPTLGLAPLVLEDISRGLEEISKLNVTVVLCEQNVTFAMRHADRVYLLENGAIDREGTPDSMRGDDYIQRVYLGE